MPAKPQSAKPQQRQQQEAAGRRDRNAVSEQPGDKPKAPEWTPCPACSNRRGKPTTCQRQNDWRGIA